MAKPENWIKVTNAEIGHQEMYENFRDVLWDMGIDIWKDDDLAYEEGVDLFVCLKKKQEFKDES